MPKSTSRSGEQTHSLVTGLWASQFALSGTNLLRHACRLGFMRVGHQFGFFCSCCCIGFRYRADRC